MFGSGATCNWCGMMMGCTNVCNRCFEHDSPTISVIRKRLSSKKEPPEGPLGVEEVRRPTLEDALDLEREGYLRPDLLEMFRDACILVEESLLDLIEGHPVHGVMNDFIEQLDDAGAFIRSGGKDAKSMFECQAWHLFLYTARILEPDSPHFAWYPGHQQITAFNGVYHDLRYEISSVGRKDPRFARSAEVLEDKNHELSMMVSSQELEFGSERNVTWLERQFEDPNEELGYDKDGRY
ncbi:hypothetical protein TWF506_010539 [Arthrobotrys conoides]|uniref:Uncharacterized protein n=1 Tax=Arthrobotrys conoides TaxID=74498 RepID=A0AAN8N6M5_9PEZI